MPDNTSSIWRDQNRLADAQERRLKSLLTNGRLLLNKNYLVQADVEVKRKTRHDTLPTPRLYQDGRRVALTPDVLDSESDVSVHIEETYDSLPSVTKFATSSTTNVQPPSVVHQPTNIVIQDVESKTRNLMHMLDTFEASISGTNTPQQENTSFLVVFQPHLTQRAVVPHVHVYE